jgi:hypothetical protein
VLEYHACGYKLGTGTGYCSFRSLNFPEEGLRSHWLELKHNVFTYNLQWQGNTFIWLLISGANSTAHICIHIYIYIYIYTCRRAFNENYNTYCVQNTTLTTKLDGMHFLCKTMDAIPRRDPPEAPIHVFLFQQQMAGSVTYLSLWLVIWTVLLLPSWMRSYLPFWNWNKMILQKDAAVAGPLSRQFI